MGRTPIEYDLLAIFVAVADEMSFSKAATRLGIGKGSVSRAVSRLEDAVGAELIHRTTHKVALSTAGTALYERIAPHLNALDQALEKLPESRQQPSGKIRMTVPHDFALIVLPELVAQFALRYPEVSFDIQVTNTIVDLVSGGFDLAIRVAREKLQDSTLTARKLGPVSVGFYASPSYLARRGVPAIPGDESHEWLLLTGVVARAPKQFRPRLVIDDVLSLCHLARSGMGIARFPRFIAEPYVADGTLVRILSDQTRLAMGNYFFVYPSRGQLPRKVSAFRDFLIERLKSRPLDRG